MSAIRRVVECRATRRLVERPAVRRILRCPELSRAMMCVRLPSLLLLFGVGAPLSAQVTTEAANRAYPAWMTRWSPLNELGSLSRTLPTADQSQPLLFTPSPRVGMLWTAGNPAGAAWETSLPRSEYAFGLGSEDGVLRRPLDAEAVSDYHARADGWRSVGSRGGAIGSVRFAQTRLDPSAVTVLSEPYATPRLLSIDTSNAPFRRIGARLDGAAGWKLGGWALGGALGYDTRSSTSVDAAFVRRNRVVLPAARLGIAHRWQDGRFRVGAHVGGQRGEEVIDMTAVGGVGLVFQLEGYRTVPGSGVLSTPYYERISRDARTAVVSAGGSSRVTEWTVFAGGVSRDDRFTGTRANDPPSDIWNSAGFDAGASARRNMLDDRMSLHVEARMVQLTGAATLLQADSTGLHTDEQRITSSAEARIRSEDSRWHVVVRASLDTERRTVEDSAAALRSDVRGVTPGFALEGSHALSTSITGVGGFSYVRYQGTGTIPDPAFYSLFYRRIFATELDMATSTLGARGFTLGLRWTRPDGYVVWLTGRSEQRSLMSDNRDFIPAGNRTASSLTIGVTMQ